MVTAGGASLVTKRAQAFDRLLGREQREGLRLRLHGVAHVEAAPDVGLAENAQLHERWPFTGLRHRDRLSRATPSHRDRRRADYSGVYRLST